MIFRYISFIIFILCSSSAYSIPSKTESKMLNTSIFKLNIFDHVYGKSDAPIEVVEYFSLTCPHCENFFLHIFPKLKKEYIDTGKVRWVKRSYAMDNSSQKGTLLLYCAGKEQYEKYLGVLLAKQASWAYQKDPIPILRNIATLGGMSIKQFNECQENKIFQTEIKKTADEGKRILNISGTPSFYVNQEKITLYTYKSFQDHFDKILSGK